MYQHTARTCYLVLFLYCSLCCGCRLTTTAHPPCSKRTTGNWNLPLSETHGEFSKCHDAAAHKRLQSQPTLPVLCTQAAGANCRSPHRSEPSLRPVLGPRLRGSLACSDSERLPYRTPFPAQNTRSSVGKKSTHARSRDVAQRVRLSQGVFVLCRSTRSLHNGGEKYSAPTAPDKRSGRHNHALVVDKRDAEVLPAGCAARERAETIGWGMRRRDFEFQSTSRAPSAKPYVK